MRNVTKGLFLTLIVSIALSSIAVASLKDGLLGYWNLSMRQTEKQPRIQAETGTMQRLRGNGIQWKPNGGKLGLCLGI